MIVDGTWIVCFDFDFPVRDHRFLLFAVFFYGAKVPVFLENDIVHDDRGVPCEQSNPESRHDFPKRFQLRPGVFVFMPDDPAGAEKAAAFWYFALSNRFSGFGDSSGFFHLLSFASPAGIGGIRRVEHGRHVFCLFVRFMPASSLVVWYDSRVFQSPACERANEWIFDFAHAECDFSRFVRLSYFRTLQRVVFSKKLLDRSWRLVYHQFVYVSFLVSLCEAGETEKIHGTAGKRICRANALLFRNRG